MWGYKLALYLPATTIGWVGGTGTMSEAVHDLGALRALREVGRRGSIAAAATVLGVSQQALSARMRTLERTTNVTLLVRSPGGSHLTEQGRLIVGSMVVEVVLRLHAEESAQPTSQSNHPQRDERSGCYFDQSLCLHMCFSFVKDHRAHPAPSGARRCKINSKAVWEIIPRTVPGFCSGLSCQRGA